MKFIENLIITDVKCASYFIYCCFSTHFFVSFHLLRSLVFISSRYITYSICSIFSCQKLIIDFIHWLNWIHDASATEFPTISRMHFRTSVHIIRITNNINNNNNQKIKLLLFDSILFSCDFRLELNRYISNARNHRGYVEFAIQLHVNSLDFLFIYFTKYDSCFAMCIVSFCLYFA